MQTYETSHSTESCSVNFYSVFHTNCSKDALSSFYASAHYAKLIRIFTDDEQAIP